MLKSKFEALPKLWPGLKGPQAITCHRSWPKSIFLGHYPHYWFTPRNVKDEVRRQPPNVPRLQINPQAARKPTQFALWATHSSAGGAESGNGRARRSWLHGEDFREELVTQWLARRDPFLRPSEQPCTEGSYSCFTSSVLAIRVAVFPFHSNRNHSHTSVSVSCCTQNAKKLLRCFAVRTNDPPTFFYNKFNLQDAKDWMVHRKLL